MHVPPAKVLAHRGACHRAPENTLPAFETALRLGVDGTELDVQLCPSGELVVIHDLELWRLARVTGRVARTPFRELQKLDVGGHFSADFKNTRIPLLQEVLDLFQTRHLVNIEMKVDAATGRTLPLALGHFLRKHPPACKIIVSSFHPLALLCLQRNFPEIEIGYLWAPEQPWWLRHGGARYLFKLRSVHPHHSQVTAKLLRQTRLLQQQVFTWTVDKEKDFRRLVELGVDGVISNVPDQLLAWRDDGPPCPQAGQKGSDTRPQEAAHRRHR